MSDRDPTLEALAQGRARFMELVSGIRPDLHRYCARLTGSVIDGEDIVQETLARAYYQLSSTLGMPELRPWLFRVAHNAAMDFLRKADRRLASPLDDAAERGTGEGDPALLRAALSSFLALPARQRSAVILKDVLGFSLEEIAEATGMTLLAVKSALVRGRTGLQEHAAELEPEAPPTPEARRERLGRLNRYVSLFNDGNWGALRSMLSDEVRLDMVSHRSLRGREVGNYYTRYADVPDIHLDVVLLEDREAIMVTSTGPSAQPPYFMLLEFAGDQVASIRDFRYVPYIAQGAEVRAVP
jgi:RNA polymerase sigma factor (sigma-70 family)